MNLKKSIENIRASCKDYIDPDLVSFIIDDDNYMGANNILEIDGYGILKSDTYEERLLKIMESENVFIAFGMITFMPILNECDIFSNDDYHFDLTAEEFDLYSSEEEKLFGILIKKGSDDYLIGKTDVCSCSVDASFVEFEKSDSKLYLKIKEIIDSKIIY